MKKLDRLVLSNLLPPFIGAFFTALFVLMMQFLWLWIDDLIGKGADMFIILELLGYLLVSFIPWSIPIAILISSVMVFGNLGEHYELSSFKSAGVSLFRIMRTGILFGVLCGVLTYLSANYIIPVANLKYRTRLFDIRKQKPTLSIESGIFNYDFQGYTMRVQKKGANDRDLEGMLIYDYSSSNPSDVNVITARRGEMYASGEGRYLVMRLYDGHQFQESPTARNQGSKASFIRSSFSEWEKTFDLSEFEISRSDEELFKTHQAMMSGKQLLEALDTIQEQITVLNERTYADLHKDFEHALILPEDTSSTALSGEASALHRITSGGVRYYEQIVGSDLSGCRSLAETFPDSVSSILRSQARVKLLDAKSRLSILESSIVSQKENRAKHIFEYHNKFAFGAICIVFLFIGVSLGAIVRKGGYGYPLLIAIVFFTVFISLNFSFRKLAETLQLDAALCAWIPCLVLAPVAAWFTYKAHHDARFMKIRLFSPRFLSRLKLKRS